MSRKKSKKNNQGKINHSIIKEETKHNGIIPDNMKRKLRQGDKRTFQPLKKKKKPCDKKKGYFDLQTVNQVIARRQEAEPGLFLRSYSCDFCKKYHITSQTEEENGERVGIFNALSDKNILKKSRGLLK